MAKDFSTMIEVCEDRGPSRWLYCADDGYFYRFYSANNDYTRILGRYLPDPEMLWHSKSKLQVKNGDRVDMEACKPTSAVFKLYEFYKNLTSPQESA